MGSDADDTVLVEILRCILADIRNVGGKFLHSAFGVTDFGYIFIDMYGSEDIPADHPFRENNGILIVVSFPWHECYLEVAAECEFSVLCGISFSQHLSLLNFVSLSDYRLEKDSGALVGSPVYRKLVYCDFR